MATWDWEASFDQEDVATLESIRELPEDEVLKIVLPASEHRGGRRFRCCRKDTFAQFCTRRHISRFAHSEGGGETQAFTATPLVAVDMPDDDVDFVLRYLERRRPGPAVLHVARVERVEPRRVRDPVDGVMEDPRQQVVAHLHHVAEAEVERSLWRALDAAMARLARGRCPMGHALSLLDAPVHWVCDGCERHFTRAARPNRCSQNCDYDLCDRCAPRAAIPGADAAAVADLKSSLAEILETGISDAGACALPLGLAPPRSCVWSGRSAREEGELRLSERVTKWNAFRIPADVAEEVRRAFLAALGAAAAGEDDESQDGGEGARGEGGAAAPWEDFQPGTGRSAARKGVQRLRSASTLLQWRYWGAPLGHLALAATVAFVARRLMKALW